MHISMQSLTGQVQDNVELEKTSSTDIKTAQEGKLLSLHSSRANQHHESGAKSLKT
jgi:hypothetical protein